MSPIKARWTVNHDQLRTVSGPFGQRRCRDLVCKMIKGGERFTEGDRNVYDWLMKDMDFICEYSSYAKFIAAFRMVLRHAWEGGEKIFFDLELLRKLDVALGLLSVP